MKAGLCNTYRRLKDLVQRPAITDSRNEANPGDLIYCIERFSVFQGRTCLAGWAFSEARRITRVSLVTTANERFPLRSYGLRSEDVANTHGNKGSHARFHDLIDLPSDRQDLIGASLVFELDNGSTITIGHLEQSRQATDPVHRLYTEFQKCLDHDVKGHFLEIGSRARSGITRRQIVPAGWTYTGFDIVVGENVNVIGDAHKLSRYLPAKKYDAVMAFSVLEHLIMPWKFIIELNQVMKVNAVGFFSAPQCWPVHDDPWDFWRFSSEAWAALLNHQTGFEIIDAKMGEPAFVVANVCCPVVNFLEAPGYLVSSVLFRKISGTTLTWPVDLDDILSKPYPHRGD